MLKTKIVAALALSAIAGLAQAAPPSAVRLTPYCDTLHDLTITNGVVTGMWDSDCDGTPETTIAGPVGKLLSGVVGGYAMAANTYPLYGVTEEVVLHNDGSWVILFSDGGTLASGTWEALVEGTRSGAKAIHAK